MNTQQKLVVLFKLGGRVLSAEESSRKLGRVVSSVEYLRALDAFLRFQLENAYVSPAEAVAVFNDKCHRDMGMYYRASYIMEAFNTVTAINPAWLLEGGTE